jgi:hypothetical protein
MLGAHKLQVLVIAFVKMHAGIEYPHCRHPCLSVFFTTRAFSSLYCCHCPITRLSTMTRQQFRLCRCVCIRDSEIVSPGSCMALGASQRRFLIGSWVPKSSVSFGARAVALPNSIPWLLRQIHWRSLTLIRICVNVMSELSRASPLPRHMQIEAG